MEQAAIATTEQGDGAQMPTLRQRWYYAIPMFMTFLLMALLVVLRRRIEVMYVEMEIGYLPEMTQYVCSSFRFLDRVYFLWMPAMLALSWVHFGLSAKTKEKLRISAITYCMLFVLGLGTFAYAMILPLTVIVGTVGGGGAR